MSDSNNTAAQVQALAEEAEALMTQFLPDQALKKALRALELAPEHPALLELTGEILLEMGDIENAITNLRKSIELSPDEGGTARYMYMGQLSAGVEAIAYFGKGVELLTGALDAGAFSSEEESAALRRQISNAYVAMAEIFLTDACEEPNAEAECERYLTTAVETDPSNYEAQQSLASMRISQCRNEDAEAALDSSANMWSSLEPIDKPPVEFQLTTAQLYYELGSHEKCLQVLASVIETESSTVDAWYLASLCEIAIEDWASAAAHLLRARTLATALNAMDDDFSAELESRLTDVAQALEAAGESIDDYVAAAAEEESSILAAIASIEKEELPDDE